MKAMKDVKELKTQFPIRLQISMIERIRKMTPQGMSVNGFIGKMIEDRLAEYEKMFGSAVVSAVDTAVEPVDTATKGE